MSPKSTVASLSVNAKLNDDFLNNCYRGDVEAVKSSIEAGADVNCTFGLGITGLMLCKTPELLEVLIKKGANVNLANSSGVTALMTQGDSLEKVRMLFDAGAEVNAVSNVGVTALMNARAPDAVAFLLEKKADVNARDKSKTSVLMHAVMRGGEARRNYHYSKEDQCKTIKLLIKEGAQINYRRKSDRKTALMMVRELDDAILLIEANADVTLKDTKHKLAHQQSHLKGKESEKIEAYLKACLENCLLKKSSFSAINDTPSSIEIPANIQRKRL